MQRISQDVVFRSHSDDVDIGLILQEYSRVASNLTPNDLLVVTYAMYSRVVRVVRDPEREDANESLALSIFHDELKATNPQYLTLSSRNYSNHGIIIPSK